jgi:thiosulfate dehydrogenase
LESSRTSQGRKNATAFETFAGRNAGHRRIRIGHPAKEPQLKKFIAGMLLGLLLIPLGVYFYFASGRAPTATADAPLPFEKRLAKMALRAKLLPARSLKAPIAAEEAALVSGAKIYKENCAVCHGLPDQPVTVIPKGMFPYPPQLFHGEEMVTDDPVGTIYWKAANGIRLTGMPAFKSALDDTQLWQVSLLLANADKLPPAAKELLK